MRRGAARGMERAGQVQRRQGARHRAGALPGRGRRAAAAGDRRPAAAVALPFIAASLVIHIGYYIALAGAYKHGELGLTYPIMRGFAPLLVALGSSAVLAEAPTPLAWAGILGITLGVALVGLGPPGRNAAPPQGAGLRLRQRADHRRLYLRRRQGRARDGRRRAHGRSLRDAAVRARRPAVSGTGVLQARRRRPPRDPGLRAATLAAGRARRRGLDRLVLRSRCGR